MAEDMKRTEMERVIEILAVKMQCVPYIRRGGGCKLTSLRYSLPTRTSGVGS